MTSIPDHSPHIQPLDHAPAVNLLDKDVQSQLRRGTYDFAALQPTIKALNQLAKTSAAAGTSAGPAQQVFTRHPACTHAADTHAESIEHLLCRRCRAMCWMSFLLLDLSA